MKGYHDDGIFYISDGYSIRLEIFQNLQTKPSPNETTTLTLKARGARRAALSPAPQGSAVRVSTVWIEHSNPYQKTNRIKR